ncbi:hypothetical protein ACF0H5_017664 [Mactra antiquata]
MAHSGHNVGKMSEETFEYICTPCDRENKTFEAVKYCVECKDYCCQSCIDIHKKYSTLIGHSFLDVGLGNQPGNQSTSLPEFPTERCSIHKGKIVDMYCETHGTVGCYACIAKDHNACPGNLIHSVPDMLHTLFNLSDFKQTQAHLTNMLAFMVTLSESTDARLEALNKAKHGTLGQIKKFQRVIESIFIEAANKSRKAVEEAYKKLEEEILQIKRNIDETRDELHAIDATMHKATAANRAHRFVCSKLAEKVMKEAANTKVKTEMNDNSGVEISFHPNQKLKDYIQGVNGIGEVQIATKKKNDLYKIKGSRDISIEVSSDTKRRYSRGCCLTDDHQLLVTDENNKKVKRFDTHTLTLIDDCILDSSPYGICCSDKQEVAVGCRSPHKIQFISIGKKMIPTRKIDTSHTCFGIAMKNDNLYVTDDNSSMYVYDMSGTKLRTITHDAAGNKLFTHSEHIAINKSRNRMFVGNYHDGFVCFDGIENHLSTIKDSDLRGQEGVCSDGRGNIFVAGNNSHNVVQFDEDGKKVGVVVKKEDGINSPTSNCFHQNTNRLYVTMWGSDILKMYELE